MQLIYMLSDNSLKPLHADDADGDTNNNCIALNCLKLTGAHKAKYE